MMDYDDLLADICSKLDIIQSRPSNELADKVMLKVRLLCDEKRELQQKLLKSESQVIELKIENEVFQRTYDDLRKNHHSLSVNHEMLKLKAGQNTQPDNAGPSIAIASTSRRETNALDDGRRRAEQSIIISDSDDDDGINRMNSATGNRQVTRVQSSPNGRNGRAKKNICYVCDKRFDAISMLERHLRVHTKEKPFSCASCGQSFSQKSSLTTHMRIHNGVKPFQCRCCDAKFQYSRSLKKHMREVHVSERD